MDRRQLSLSLLAAALAWLLVATPFAAQAGVYQWRDAAGRVHFSDRDPGNGATSLPSAPTGSTAREAGPVIRIDDADGVLDTASRDALEQGIRNIHGIYTGLFHLAMRKAVVVDIHLFATRGELAAWAAGIDRTIALPASIYGVYLVEHDTIGAWKHSEEPAAIVRTLLHESSHVMLAQLSPNAPAWLQEGMAQYFEGIGTGAGARTVAPKADAAAAIDLFVARRQLVTLRQYFALDERQWRHLAHVQQNPVPYTVAWSVCHFLMGKPVGRQIIGELLQDMEKAKRLPTQDAIEKRYPGGYAMMEYDWFAWAQKPKTPHTLPL